MEETLFRDEDELVKDTIAKILTVHDVQTILEDNDLEDDDVLFLLYINGYITLPEVEPL